MGIKVCSSILQTEVSMEVKSSGKGEVLYNAGGCKVCLQSWKWVLKGDWWVGHGGKEVQELIGLEYLGTNIFHIWPAQF